jgi:hypothetical protein
VIDPTNNGSAWTFPGDSSSPDNIISVLINSDLTIGDAQLEAVITGAGTLPTISSISFTSTPNNGGNGQMLFDSAPATYDTTEGLTTSHAAASIAFNASMFGVKPATNQLFATIGIDTTGITQGGSYELTFVTPPPEDGDYYTSYVDNADLSQIFVSTPGAAEIDVTPTNVPEPSTIAQVFSVVAMAVPCWLWQRRRRQASLPK